jgi:hypothetical protein
MLVFMASNWVKIENFPHRKGSHCESTALRDHINFLGYNFSEAMIFGLDATMGFAYFGKWADESGMLIGGKNGTISDKSLACRIMGINIEKKDFGNSNLAWNDAKSSLDKGEPLIIMADMGFLPYFDWEEEFHFGGHSISLVGYNEKEQLVKVCDNNFDEAIDIPLIDLKKARNSKHGSKWLWPYNMRYILKKRPDGKKPPFSAGLKLAIQYSVKNMLAASMSNNGIQGLGQFADSIGNWKTEFENQPEKSKFKLEMIFGYIEEFGTGGAMFRNLYTQFLEEILKHPEINGGDRQWRDDEIDLLKNNIPIIKDSAKKWTMFANIIKEKLNSDGDNAHNKLDYEQLESIIRDVFNLEKTFFTNMNELKLP